MQHGTHGADQVQIGHIKAPLRLTHEQEQYCPPVEAVLQDMNGRGADGGTMAAKPVVLDEVKLQRLVSAAMPLLMTLDEGRKRHGGRARPLDGSGPAHAPGGQPCGKPRRQSQVLKLLDPRFAKAIGALRCAWG